MEIPFFDDSHDQFFLTLLSTEIQDDHTNVITEGLQLQHVLMASLTGLQASLTCPQDSPIVASSSSSSSPMVLTPQSPSLEPLSDFPARSSLMPSSTVQGGNSWKPLVPHNPSPSLVPAQFTDSELEEDKDEEEETSDEEETWVTFCGICLESKEKDEMFRVKGCRHHFCNDCMKKHAEEKIQNGDYDVKCPTAGCDTAVWIPVLLSLWRSLDL